MPFYNNFNRIYGCVVFFILLTFLFTLIPLIIDGNWNEKIKSEGSDGVRKKIPLYIVPDEEGDKSFYTLHPDNWSEIFTNVATDKRDEIHSKEEREIVLQSVTVTFFGIMFVTCLVHCVLICTLPNDRRCSEVFNTIVFGIGYVVFIIGPILAFISLAKIDSKYSEVTDIVMDTVNKVAAAENVTIQGSVKHFCDYNENGEYLAERRSYHVHYRRRCGLYHVCAHDEIYYYNEYRRYYVPKYEESRDKANEIGICQAAWSKNLGIFFAIVTVLMLCWVFYAMKYEYQMGNTQAILVQPVDTKSQVQVYYQAYPSSSSEPQGYAYPTNKQLKNYNN